MYKIFFVTKLTALLILVGNVTVKAAIETSNETHSGSSAAKADVYTLCGPWSDWTQCNHLNKQHRSRACTHRKGAVPDYSGKQGDLTPQERESFDKYFQMLNNGQNGDFVQMPEIQTRTCTSEYHDLDEGMSHSAPETNVHHIREEVGGDIDTGRSRRRSRSESSHSHSPSREHPSDPRRRSADSRSPSARNENGQTVKEVTKRTHGTGFKARREARERKKIERQEREKQRKIREEARKYRLRSGIYRRYPAIKARDIKEMEDDEKQRRLDEMEAKSDDEERERDVMERRKRKNKGATETATAQTSATGSGHLPPAPATSGGANPLDKTPTSPISETHSEPTKAPLYEDCTPWGDWTPCNDVNKQHRFRRCKYKRGQVPDYSSRVGDMTENEKIKYEVVNRLASQYDDADHVNKNDIETRICPDQAQKNQPTVVVPPNTPNSSTVSPPKPTKAEVAETAIKQSVAQPITANPPVGPPKVVGETKKVQRLAVNERDNRRENKPLEGYPTVINGPITPVVRLKRPGRGHDLPPEIPMLTKEAHEKLMKKFSPNLFKPLAVDTNKSKIPIRKPTPDLEGDITEPEDESTDEDKESSPLVPVSSEKTSLRRQIPKNTSEPSTEAPKAPVKKQEPVKQAQTIKKQEPVKQAQPVKKQEPVKVPTNEVQPTKEPEKKPVVDSKAQDKSEIKPAETAVSSADKATTSKPKSASTPTSPQKKPLVSAGSKPKAPVKRSPSPKPKPKPKPTYKPRPKSPAPRPKPPVKPKPKVSTTKPAPSRPVLPQPPKDVVKTVDSTNTTTPTNNDQSNTTNPDTSSLPPKSGGDLPPIVPDVEAESATKNQGGDLPPIVPDVEAESAKPSETIHIPTKPEAESDKKELNMLPEPVEVTPESTENKEQGNDVPLIGEPVDAKSKLPGTEQQDPGIKVEEPIKPNVGANDRPEPQRITVKNDESSDNEVDPNPALPTDSSTPENVSNSTTVKELDKKVSTESSDEPVGPEERELTKPEEAEPVKAEDVKPVKPEVVEPEEPEDKEITKPEEAEPVKAEDVKPVEPEDAEPPRSEDPEPVGPEDKEPTKPEETEAAEPTSEDHTEKPEVEDKTKQKVEEIGEESKKPLNQSEDDENDYEPPRIRIPTSDDPKDDTTEQSDDIQTKPELPKVEEQPITNPEVNVTNDDFTGDKVTTPTKPLEPKGEGHQSENTPGQVLTEDAKPDGVDEDLAPNGKDGLEYSEASAEDEEPEDDAEEEPEDEPEEESPHHDETGDKSQKTGEAPRFGRGVSIAAGVVGVLAFLAAGGAGYHYTRKKKRMYPHI
ncbi:hypothetical protein MACK_000499 [Theileria orientalis]|uniref:Titin n=1 Tax=Theileria orientalis TaxID=68886 RepID=A0A976QUE6_THEOR|nr:hypothetical protein MACK_000499 [Theileria orientalis]